MPRRARSAAASAEYCHVLAARQVSGVQRITRSYPAHGVAV